jgi:hypothetical protein
VLCVEWTQAFNDISNLGTSIPLSQVMAQAVSAAKTFAQNGLGAKEFFEGWVGGVCGVMDWDEEVWGALIGAPDSVGKSVGCFRKDRDKCRRGEILSSHPVENAGTRLWESKMYFLLMLIF